MVRLDGTELWRLPGAHSSRVNDLVFAPDGLLASAGGDGTAVLIDPRDGSPIGEPLRGIGGDALKVAFTPDGRGVVTVSADTVATWDLDTLTGGRRLVVTAPGELGGLRDTTLLTAIGAGGDQLVTDGKELHIWAGSPRQPGRAIRTRSESEFHIDHQLAVSADGSRAVIPSDELLEIWDPRARKKVGGFRVANSGLDEIRVTAITADGSRVGYGLAGLGVGPRAGVIDLRTGRTTAAIALRAQTVTALAFSADGTTLATADGDDHLRFWDTASGRELSGGRRTATQVQALSYSPDGGMLAIVDQSGELTLWDARRRQPLGAPMVDPAGPLARVVFSPDSRLIATMSVGGSFSLWDAASAQWIGRGVLAHRDSVSSIENAPDDPLPDLTFADGGDTLVTSSIDGSVTFWDLRPSSWERNACVLAGRNLTRAEWDKYVGGAYTRTCAQWPEG
jgi:WD40 repeat protein